MPRLAQTLALVAVPIAVFAALDLAACASPSPLGDDASASTIESAAGGTSSEGAGGAGLGEGAGGAVGSGGSGMECPPTPPHDPKTLGAPCCAKGPAHCVPNASVPGNLAASFASCDAASGGGGRCLPDEIISAGSSFKPQKCTVPVFKVEGVCLSSCIPLISENPNANLLQKADCAAEGDVCVPCVSPLDDKPTGACALPAPGCGGASGGGGSSGGAGGKGGSAGAPSCPYKGPPLLDPKKLAACSPACGGAHCVPKALVPPAQQSQLAACSGPDGAGYCTPDPFIESAGNGVPDACVSVGGAEGRCLSECLPVIADKASLLPKSSCHDGERCAPCFDPTAADPKKATGACSLACDAPTKPPLVLACPYVGAPLVDPSAFPACSPACGGAHCVPSSLVPASEAAQLAKCPGGYCAPDAIVASGGYGVPATCAPFAGVSSEGRCLSECLPSVAAEGSALVQATCAPTERCVPCIDPFSGKDTGACRLACDAPAKPKTTFPPCCGGSGTCVPGANLDPKRAKSLKQEACPGGAAAFKCVPDEYLPGSNVPVGSCFTLLGKGACVSTCVDLGFFGGFLEQGGCAGGHVCAPCALAPGGTPGC